MRHVVAADDVGGVREPVRVLVAGRAQQQRGRVGGAAGDDDDVAAVRLLAAAAVDDDPRRPSVRTRRSPAARTLAWVRSVTFGCSSAGRTQRTWASALPSVEAGEAVEAVAAHAAALLGIGLVEVDPDREVERLVARFDEIVVELLDARLVRDRRVGERAGARRLGRVLAGLAVDEVEPLGLGVVGLEVGVGDRPRRRDAAVVRDLAEVALAKAEQDRAVDLGVAADEVLRVRAEARRRACRTSAPS